jgi:hypothetical protein
MGQAPDQVVTVNIIKRDHKAPELRLTRLALTNFLRIPSREKYLVGSQRNHKTSLDSHWSPSPKAEGSSHVSHSFPNILFTAALTQGFPECQFSPSGQSDVKYDQASSISSARDLRAIRARGLVCLRRHFLLDKRVCYISRLPSDPFISSDLRYW